MKGSCSCGEVTFELTDKPMFTHCCHCRMCQRATGTAFALNALIEADRVKHLSGALAANEMPSDKPQGQVISRCPNCQVAVWSTYPGNGPKFLYVRVGTLEDPDQCPPDIHIFTESRQPWVKLADDVPAVAQFYDRDTTWPAASIARRAAVLGDT